MHQLHAGAPAAQAAETLERKLRDRTATLAVIGLGYVGLPVAVERAKLGYNVIGYDVNAIRVAQLNQGLNYIRNVSDDDVAAVVGAHRLSASTDYSSLDRCDAIVICLPTPLTASKEPDVSHVRAAAELIAARLRVGQLICMEGVTYPGATEDVLLPALNATGLTVGRDFFVAASPERVDPGNTRYTAQNTAKVVAGVTPACLEVARALYEQTVTEITVARSPRVAEMTRVVEDAFRAVNIAFMNEMALLADRIGVSIWDVLDATATTPFGMMRFNPGPGVGGPCVPLDPFYIAWVGKQHDFAARLTQTAGELNASMPRFVRDKVVRALETRGVALKQAQLLAIGVAYKKDIAEWRYSPAVDVIELLEAEGASVSYFDPHIPSFKNESGKLRHSVPLTVEALRAADCVLILTDHSDIDWPRVVQNARLVVDTRNATKQLADRGDKVILL